MTALLTAERLSVRYGERVAVRDVDLEIVGGRITALVGPSGCGKTSFLTALNRLTDLIPGCRVDGALRLGALDVLAPTTDVVALRRRIGLVFQRPNPFPLSIRRNVELALREHGTRGRAALDAVVERVLREVGLWDEVGGRLDAPATTLSGGQQQRLCLARALALEPEVLLMDEPCSALDPLASAVVEDRIAALRGRYTVVVVTHDLAQARRLADDAAVFWVADGAGRLIERGPAEQVLREPRSELVRRYVRG